MQPWGASSPHFGRLNTPHYTFFRGGSKHFQRREIAGIPAEYISGFRKEMLWGTHRKNGFGEACPAEQGGDGTFFASFFHGRKERRENNFMNSTDKILKFKRRVTQIPSF